MTQDARSSASNRKKNTSPNGKSESRSRSTTGPVFQHYEAAVLLLQQGKYEKALSALEKLLPEAPAEIQDRCRIYISTCQRQLQSRGRSFATPEEHYDYAISLLNTGYYEEAREQLNLILGDHPDADYACYGLAVLESITGHTQQCLTSLSRAIELNPRCRVQARADNDFQNMADDPRFTELLYPEVP
ncbi:MAG: TPR end-of-group domain-containing protein [Terracidiphilus sp.]